MDVTENENTVKLFLDDIFNNAKKQIRLKTSSEKKIDNIDKENIIFPEESEKNINNSQNEDIIKNFVDEIFNEAENNKFILGDYTNKKGNIIDNNEILDNENEIRNNSIPFGFDIYSNITFKGNNDNNKIFENNPVNSIEEKLIGSKFKSFKRNDNNYSSLYSNKDESENDNKEESIHNYNKLTEEDNIITNDILLERANNILFQSQKIPSTHIILRKINPFKKDFYRNCKRNSLRREYQRRNKNKGMITEKFEIIYDNYPNAESQNLYLNKNYEHILEKARLNNRKNKKLLPVNILSKIQINKKLKEIISKISTKKKKTHQKTIKSYFNKWKYILSKIKKNQKDNKIIIHNNIYKASPNEDNEFVYKIPNTFLAGKKEHFGYYDNSIVICHQISLRIYRGVFYLNKNQIIDFSYEDENNKDEDMEIFVVKNVKNRNLYYQNIYNYTYNGIK